MAKATYRWVIRVAVILICIGSFIGGYYFGCYETTGGDWSAFDRLNNELCQKGKRIAELEYLLRQGADTYTEKPVQ